jgi:hypothetical protein
MAILDVAIRHVAFPDDDAGTAHRQVEAGVRVTQRLPSLPKLGDVRAGSEPLRNGSVAVPYRHTARFEPAVLAVSTAHAVFDVIGMVFGHRVQPKLSRGG